ncbi:MAG: cation diffusion facilitator family transporter [Blastocatellia bacterium]|nr:cation diffusion facilitator family transporter [Blastocatellia bacterium]MCS7156387.1 cation diffusion facilitator family transporter [Blastocatellia bacterium]MCX7751262.1 cation diffusion facilitator family transporter [Blastocatellia bacterium]MDW8168974.1 cation diffusion facilitator family transporter [Acidobacteriota bacterium]MDW8256734.1 cation diffusion facilitator family transporter [Acidobacteriota bacterium]
MRKEKWQEQALKRSPLSSSRYREDVQRVLRRVLVLNVAVVLGKLLIGWRANSLSIVSDAVHSSVDAMNNIVGLIIIRYATAAPDAGHPYGHRKIESLAAFALGGALLVTCVEIISRAIERLQDPSRIRVHIEPLTLAVLIGTIVVNVAVFIYERRKGHALGSPFLLADALHTRSDILVSGALLVGLMFIRWKMPILDPLLALAISALIAASGWQIFARTVPILIDAAPVSAERVEAIVRGVPGVKQVRAIRSRSDGERIFLDLVLVLNPEDVRTAHEITERVEERLCEALGPCQVTIHMEPS